MKEDIFSEINSYEKSYWLGFIAADGSVRNNSLTIGLASKDKEHLEKFKSFLVTDKEVKFSLKHCQGKTYDSNYITIFSKQIISDLSKYGIIENKSNQDINFLENIPEKYKISFVFRLIDGDGWFTFSLKTNSKSIGFCGNKSIVSSTAKFLSEFFNWDKITISQDKKSLKTFYFNISNKTKIKDFLNEYLKFKNTFLLKRKENKAMAILESFDKIYSKTEELHKCQYCKTLIPISLKYCSQECLHLSQRVVNRPSREELKKLIRTNSFLAIGKNYNVSDNAIRKWCVAYNLPKTKKDIKKYSDEEWNQI